MQRAGTAGFLPPIGYITMFAGAWTDNVTIPGWYKCDGANGTPNLVNQFIRGGVASGAVGGSDTHTLITAQMPNHSHTFTVYENASSGAAVRGAIPSGDTHVVATSAVGGGGAHENRPAFYTLIFIQRRA